MKVMVFVKATPNSEAETLFKEPGKLAQLFAEMGRYNEELVKAGIMKGGDGLKPSKFGKRIRFSGKQRSVVDGPFAETKELVAGFWIWEVKSIEEADFGEGFTPEEQAREAELRKRIGDA
jgi:hypothetical protein